MRILFSLPVLMLGVIAIGIYFKDGTLLGSRPFVSAPTPTPTRQPGVEGATSIVLPEVNPVLHISPPPVSMFAPAPASGEQPTAVSDVFQDGYDEYFRTMERVEHSWASSQPR